MKKKKKKKKKKLFLVNEQHSNFTKVSELLYLFFFRGRFY